MAFIFNEEIDMIRTPAQHQTDPAGLYKPAHGGYCPPKDSLAAYEEEARRFDAHQRQALRLVQP